MKTKVCMPFLMALLVVMISCNDSNTGVGSNTAPDSTTKNDQTPGDTTTQQSTASKSSIDANPLDEKSGKFATEAAGGGLMEVSLGQTAQQKAESQRVKDFGAMMVRDHTKANEELKEIANAKNFTLPASLPEKHQKHVDDLTKKQGKEFDKAYMKMMVNDHEEDIKKFEKAANESTDGAIKEYATRTLPVLRMHLDSAKAISNSIKNQ